MKNLTEGNIYKNFLLFAIPMILSSIISQATATINTAVAGAYLFEEGLAAIGATSAMNTFISSVFWGYNMGVGTYMAKLYGAGKNKQIKNAMYNNLLWMSVAVLAVSAVLIVFRYPLYRLLRVDPQIIEQTDNYFTIITAGKIFPLLNSNFVCALTAMGGSAFPFAVSLVFAVLGVFSNIFSVTVLDMGVAGIAVTSVVSSALATVVYFLKFKSNLRKLQVHKEKVKLSLGETREIFRYSLPICAQQGILYFVGVIMSAVINANGAAVTAGYVIVEKVYNLSASVFTNASKTLSNYSAQAAGAGKYKQIRKGLKVGALQGFVLTVPLIIITVVFAEPVCGFFLPKDADSSALDFAILFARYYAPFMLVYVATNLFHSLFRGLAEMRSLLISSMSGSVVRLVVSMICIRLVGAEGIFIGWVISWAADLVICIYLYQRKYKTSELLRQHLQKKESVK